MFVIDLKNILSIIDNEKVKNLLDIFNNPPPVFPVSGLYSIPGGVWEGKKMGEMGKTTRDWWIKSGCIAGKNDCYKFY